MREQAERRTYEAPRVLASYTREELTDSIRPHGPAPSYDNGCGCGCGCACSIDID